MMQGVCQKSVLLICTACSKDASAVTVLVVPAAYGTRCPAITGQEVYRTMTAGACEAPGGEEAWANAGPWESTQQQTRTHTRAHTGIARETSRQAVQVAYILQKGRAATAKSFLGTNLEMSVASQHHEISSTRHAQACVRDGPPNVRPPLKKPTTKPTPPVQKAHKRLLKALALWDVSLWEQAHTCVRAPQTPCNEPGRPRALHACIEFRADAKATRQPVASHLGPRCTCSGHLRRPPVAGDLWLPICVVCSCEPGRAGPCLHLCCSCAGCGRRGVEAGGRQVGPACRCC